jgi:enterochelin esterase family protein
MRKGEVFEIVSRLRDGGPAAFRTLAASEPVPFVRGREILFVFEAPDSAVREVRLVHHVVGLPRSPRFQRIAGGPLFALHLVLPPASRIEYTFGIRWAGGGEKIVTDPSNPRMAWCPFGPTSVAWTEGYREPDWLHVSDGVVAGRIEEHEIASGFLGTRRIGLYHPAVPPPVSGYDLLLVHDGGDYRAFASLARAWDVLIAWGAMRPVLGVLLYPQNRNEEYSCTAPHADFVVREVLPWVRGRWPVRPDRDGTVAMGASFGAVASLYLAHRYPDHVGGLFLQSGSFFFDEQMGLRSPGEPMDEFERIWVFLEEEFLPAPFGSHRMRVFQTCGTFEPIVVSNRAMARRLRAAGHEVEYRESHDGHNWGSWRDHFEQAFRWLFPPCAESTTV